METGRSPLRILAPLALVVFGLALLLVVATSGGSGEESSSSTKAAEEARDLGGKPEEKDTSQREEEEPADAEDLPKKYTVKEGDTLGGIAESTGVPVERLQELNPGLDQFSLVQGQKINLR